MPTRQKPKKKSQGAEPQIKLFKTVARSIECDKSEAVFDKALGKIGRANVAKNDVTPKQRRAKKKPLKLAI